MNKITMVKAEKSDLKEIYTLLQKSGLPLDGVSEIIKTIIIAKDADIVVGCAAVEIYDNSSLLRSVAVDKQYQGKGIGRKLTNEAINLSLENNITNIFLLTETAEFFFQNFGFEKVDRTIAPDEIQKSEEFTSICPLSASFLRLRNQVKKEQYNEE